jgi:hypothetical protein
MVTAAADPQWELDLMAAFPDLRRLYDAVSVWRGDRLCGRPTGHETADYLLAHPPPGLIADRFGWRPKSVARILVLSDDRTNRRRIQSMGPLLVSTFPGSTVDTKRWLRQPGTGQPGLWFLPASHGRAAGHGTGGRDRIRVRPKGPDLVTQPPDASLAPSGWSPGPSLRQRRPKNPSRHT